MVMSFGELAYDAMQKAIGHAQFLHIGAEWAKLMPEDAWSPGPPPNTRDKTTHVAVRTETGAVLTGSLYTFAISRDRIERIAKYGRITGWIIFGELG